MSIDAETLANGHHNELESRQENDTETELNLNLPRFKCKKCLDNGVRPIESIYFEELKDLLKHIDAYHDSNEHSKLIVFLKRLILVF